MKPIILIMTLTSSQKKMVVYSLKSVITHATNQNLSKVITSIAKLH